MGNAEVGHRIAKNTLALYFRMFFLLAVSLYTNRVVLAELGASDYGIYTVLYGLMVIIAFFTTAIANATQRFLNVELGKGSDQQQMRKVFSATVAVNLLLALVLFVLGETAGLWFVNTQMNFNPSRMVAVNWVYQFLIGNWVVGVLSAPYYSAIITNERMDIFAGFSILEAVIKLAFVLVLPFIHWHQLELFTFMVLLISCALASCYIVFSRNHFAESRDIDWYFDWNIVKKMLGFTSWTVLGVFTTSFQVQGIAILVNIFFGTIVNAAFGIAVQVNGVVKRFVQGFLTALNPHIVKSYSAGQFEEMHTYILRGCRIAIVLVLLLVLPLVLETPMVLSLWLTEVPEQTVLFVRFILLAMLIDCSTELLTVAIGATGKVKWYNVVLTMGGFIQLLVTWLLYKSGWSSDIAMYVYIITMMVMMVIRFSFVSRALSLPFTCFLKEVMGRSVAFIILSSFLPVVVYINFAESSVLSFLLICLLSILSVSGCGWICMATATERAAIVRMIKNKLIG